MATNLIPILEKHLAPDVLSLLKTVGAVASQTDARLYLVGGSVRDILLERTPDDLDLVVEGYAIKLAEAAAGVLEGEMLAHSQFGTATLKVAERRLDLATARVETYPRPGALPKVESGTLREDLSRRDFSINAMAVALSGDEAGLLVDLFHGEQDLRTGLIRVLHERSFIDDATRVFRAIRYEQRLGFKLEEDTLRLMQEALSKAILGTISGDRIRHELETILEETAPLKALLRARDLRVFRHLYPALRDVPYLERLAGQHIEEPLIYVAAIAYHLTPVERFGFIYRLNMPKQWTKVVADAVTLRTHELALGRRDVPAAKVCELLDPLSPVSLQTGLLVADEGPFKENLERYLNELRYVKSLLTGDDLLLLGVPEGPLVGEALEMLRLARLEGRASTRRDEIELVKEFLPARG